MKNRRLQEQLELKLKLKLIYDRHSVGQSVLVPRFHLGPMTRFLLSLWRLRVSWYRAPSLTRGWVCNLLVQLLVGLPRSPSELTDIFYCLIWDSPNLEGQVPVFISPRNRVAQLYPRALGSLFVSSYDSQGYSIAYFLFMRHRSHRKRSVQQFFYFWMFILCRWNIFT
jgi:hypothetical protein